MGEGGGGERGMIRKFKSWMDKKQSCPTVEDIENKELGKLAKRLKGDSDKGTLTNILEWQDRNIQFWKERRILELLWLILTGFIIVLYLVVFLPIIILLHFYLVSSNLLSASVSQILVSVIFLVFLIGFIFQNALVRIIYVLLLSYPVIYLISSVKNPAIFGDLSSASLNGVLFGAAILSLAYLMMSYYPIFRAEPLIARIKKILRMMKDTFQLSLPVNKILDYRMAICRDYAKLTAALLFNLYPNAKIYFFKFLRHVATAIKIDGKYYILDQTLPVLTIDGWLIRWNRRDADVYASELIWNSEGKLVGVDFKYPKKVFLHSGKVADADKLAAEVAEMLKIKQISQKEKPDYETLLKNYAIYYEDDDITKRSLMKAIKNKLESELCSNMDKISKIEINQDKSDLIVKVYLRTERGE